MKNKRKINSFGHQNQKQMEAETVQQIVELSRALLSKRLRNARKSRRKSE